MAGRLRGLALAAVLVAAAGGASGHDTWLRPTRGSSIDLATGNRFPQAEFPTNPGSVREAGCSDGSSRLALRVLQARPDRLALLAVTRGAPLLTCWIELAAYAVDLEPAIIPVYLDDIQASPALREVSARRVAAGLGWHESYRKFARLERTVPEASPAARAAARGPIGQGLELVVLGDQPVLAGVPFRVRLLRDGQPLADLPIERVDVHGQGHWSRTDARGELVDVLPTGGDWLLRGVDLRPEGDDHWTSRFVTLLLQLP